MSAAQRSERSRDELAVTMSGLYPSLVEWAQRVGEGRVSVVRSILAAEHSARKVHGVIVFNAGHPHPVGPDARTGATGLRRCGRHVQ